MSQNKLLFFLITFISLIALISFCFSPLFQISDIKYQGLKSVSEAKVAKIMQPYIQTNIFIIDHRKVKKQLERLDYIENVAVDKDFPDTLLLKVSEREPIARIINNGKYLTFTAGGYIIESGPLKTDNQVPLLKGMGYSLDNRNISFSSHMEKIVQALSSVNKRTRSRLDVILMKNNFFSAISVDISIELGSSVDLSKKFRILESLFYKIDQEGLKVEYIDLSVLKKPVLKVKK